MQGCRKPDPTNIASFNTRKDDPSQANIFTYTINEISMVLSLLLDTLEHFCKIYMDTGPQPNRYRNFSCQTLCTNIPLNQYSHNIGTDREWPKANKALIWFLGLFLPWYGQGSKQLPNWLNGCHNVHYFNRICLPLYWCEG